jgi:NodT family efflux transporter outer membrane factor (OMF) lipoprotein
VPLWFNSLIRAPSRRWGSLALLLLLAACEVGPDYQRPSVETPPAYKEIGGWKQAEPQDAGSAAAWWSVYGDAELDGLMRQIDISNQNLKASAAAYREALALTAQARSALFPTLSVSGSAQGVSTGGSAGGTSSNGQFSASSGVSWELDVWGKIRRNIESAEASAEASGADLAAARLSAQSQLAADYFQLRVADELKRLLDANVTAFVRSLQITQNRYDAGTAARTDVASAETQLESTRAQSIATGVSRAQFEHAIAVLIGKPPAELSIAPRGYVMSAPVVPPGLPSTLLERRPDIAAAERNMASANAQIGVALAAFYPDLTLSASYGFTGTALSGLVSASNAVWAVGPALSLTLFDAGNRSAQVEQARAAYDQEVALYRQTVLTAFQQVEDQLAALRILEQEAEVQNRAVAAAAQAVQLTLNQYEAGTVDYTAVVTAQTNSLDNQQTALDVAQSRILASVSLIVALGGGWDAGQLPPGQ